MHMMKENNLFKAYQPPFERMEKAFEEAGQDLGPNYEKVASSETFQKWFQGSTVVDKDGKPLLVHNGVFLTEGDDSSLSGKFVNGYIATEGSERGRGGLGAYFTSSLESIYALEDSYFENGTEGRYVMTHAFLNIKNPLVIPEGEDISMAIDRIFPDNDVSYEDAKSKLREMGYDGIVQKHRYGYYDDEYVAFSQDQIFMLPGQIDPSLDLEAKRLDS